MNLNLADRNKPRWKDLPCSQAGLFIDAYLDFEICFLEFHSSSKFQISLAGVMENQKLFSWYFHPADRRKEAPVPAAVRWSC